MQGEWTGESIGPDVWTTCRELIPAGSVFAFLAEHRQVLFPAEMFSDMYPSANGRPSMPPQVLATVLVLQALYGVSDVDAVQELRCDLRWKAACGLGLHDTAFDASLLTYFRRRLACSSDPNRIFGRVKRVVAETGVLAGRQRRALDSTVLDDAVATQDTVTQIIAAIRRVIREVPGAAEAAVAGCSAHDYKDPGKHRIAWHDQVAPQALVDALVGDAVRLLAGLPAQPLGERAANAVGLLALVAYQDVEPAEDSDGCDGRWRIARRTVPDRVISTVDPESRHVHKNPHPSPARPPSGPCSRPGGPRTAQLGALRVLVTTASRLGHRPPPARDGKLDQPAYPPQRGVRQSIHTDLGAAGKRRERASKRTARVGRRRKRVRKRCEGAGARMARVRWRKVGALQPVIPEVRVASPFRGKAKRPLGTRHGPDRVRAQGGRPVGIHPADHAHDQTRTGRQTPQVRGRRSTGRRPHG